MPARQGTTVDVPEICVVSIFIQYNGNLGYTALPRYFPKRFESRKSVGSLSGMNIDLGRWKNV